MKKIDSRKRKLFVVYNQAVAAAKRKNDPMTAEKICNRLKKALGIMQSLEYYLEEKALYQPTFQSCGCKDFEFRNANKRQYKGMCKHQMALILENRVNTLKYEQETFLGLLEATQVPSEFHGKIWVKGIE